MFQLFSLFILIMSSRLSFQDIMVMLVMIEMLLYLFFFTMYNQHVILLLMILELFVLKLFLLVSVMIYFKMMDSTILFIFMAISAGEAGLGVALLTLLIRAHGCDYMMVGLA